MRTPCSAQQTPIGGTLAISFTSSPASSKELKAPFRQGQAESARDGQQPPAHGSVLPGGCFLIVRLADARRLVSLGLTDDQIRSDGAAHPPLNLHVHHISRPSVRRFLRPTRPVLAERYSYQSPLSELTCTKPSTRDGGNFTKSRNSGTTPPPGAFLEFSPTP